MSGNQTCYVEKLDKRPQNEVPAHKSGRCWKSKYSEIDEWVNSGKSAIDD